MDYPKISIVTPSYNQGQFIRQTIDSVLGQNYPNLEYFIIDGGSSDNTLDILRSYGDKLDWVSEHDRGQADAINKGMRKATGEILSFINSDDYYTPGTFEMVAQKFSQTGCQWLTGDYRIVDQDSREIQGFIVRYKRFLRKFSSKTLFSMVNYLAQASTFWHRDLWIRTGVIDSTLRYALDYDIWMRAFMIEPPLIVDQSLSVFRIHKSSKGGSEFQRQFDEEIQVLRRYNKNRAINGIHIFHNFLIKLVYRMIK